MIIHTLKLQHYKQYADLELDFREGLVGIIGKNGAGKSTIFEAILYCLFGRDENNKGLVRSSFADPKANVELQLEFSIGEPLYRVKREFRGKTLTVVAELYKNDTLIAKGVSAVNDELVNILHMEREAFKRSVFSGQKELSDLSSATGEIRKRMVRRMLGLDELDNVQVRINADIRDMDAVIRGQRQTLLDAEVAETLKNEQDAVRKSLKINEQELEQAQKKLTEIEAQHRAERVKFDAEEQRFRQFNALHNEWTQARERHEGFFQRRQNLVARLEDLKAQQKQTELERPRFQLYDKNKKHLSSLEKEHQKFINRNAYLHQMGVHQKAIQDTQDKIEQLTSALQDRSRVGERLTERQAWLNDLQRQREEKLLELQHVKSGLGGLQERIQDREAKIARLKEIGREGECPTCFQPVMDAYDKVLQQLNEEVERIHQQEQATLEQQQAHIIETGKDLRHQMDEAERDIRQIRDEMTRFSELEKQLNYERATAQKTEVEITKIRVILHELGEVAFNEAEFEALKNNLSNEEPHYLEFVRADNYLSREMPLAVQEEKTLSKNLEETAQIIALKQHALDQLGFVAEHYEAAKTAIGNFDAALSAQSAIVREAQRGALEQQHRIQQIQDRLQQDALTQERIGGQLRELEDLRRLAELISLFKTEILEKVSPGISREASDLFSRITRGRYESILVDENFDFSIADGGRYYPMERFSGGEVDLANFCLRIAITKAIMDLSGGGQRLEFLAFDEIFGSQDEERRLEMMLALNYLKEQFRQIYIVSHIDSLRDYFPNLLEIQQTEGGSTAIWR